MNIPAALEQCIQGDLMFYFNATPDQHAHLPIGARFSVIYNPSPYIVGLGWRWVQYRVSLHVMPREAITAKKEGRQPEKERVYEVAKTRWLTEDEIDQCMRAWEDGR